jgi:predicted 3-demethylubiquinone-9 3-methyltransferase (glyoxalase superfamily)
MAPVTPCLWFDGTADEAADFYVEVFPNARRTGASAVPEAAPGETGSTMVVTFELDGTGFMALNGGPTYRLTPAVSFVINCKDQAEVDYYWDRLGADGREVQCGWLVDKFGISWQVVPDRLGELMSDPDPARADRTMQAMLKMVKLDVAALEAAADSR